jgi:hypothetical protein
MKLRFYLVVGRASARDGGGFDVPYWIHRTADKTVLLEGTHYSQTKATSGVKKELTETILERLNNIFKTRGYNTH